MSYKRLRTVVPALGVVASLMAVSAPADAHPANPQAEQSGAVFVQTNDPSGNQIAVYAREKNGSLTGIRRYDTGGKGGAIKGAVVDKLASQGSLVYDSAHRLLIAVNAGSGTITTFRVSDRKLSDRKVASTGKGSFPVSIAVHGNLAYVLDAARSGAVKGFRITGNKLQAIAGSERSLELDPNAMPRFVNTPGQVGFTPDGHHLVVTTKANGSNIDVFDVHGDGRLEATPTRTKSATPVPFGFVFDDASRLVVGEAATSSVTTYKMSSGDRYDAIGSVADGQAALCWIARAGKYYFVANAGSANVSAYTVDSSGRPTLVGKSGVAAMTDPGTIDLAASPDGRFLYVETGAKGIVDAFAVGANGSLTPLGSKGGLGAEQIEGIAVS